MEEEIIAPDGAESADGSLYLGIDYDPNEDLDLSREDYDPEVPEDSCQAPPGSEERMRVFAKRLSRGEHLWHGNDAETPIFGNLQVFLEEVFVRPIGYIEPIETEEGMRFRNRVTDENGDRVDLKSDDGTGRFKSRMEVAAAAIEWKRNIADRAKQEEKKAEDGQSMFDLM